MRPDEPFKTFIRVKKKSLHINVKLIAKKRNSFSHSLSLTLTHFLDQIIKNFKLQQQQQQQQKFRIFLEKISLKTIDRSIFFNFPIIHIYNHHRYKNSSNKIKY